MITEQRLNEIQEVYREASDSKSDYITLASRRTIRAIPELINEIRKLQEALRKYGEHKSECGVYDMELCSCGLVEAAGVKA